MVVITLAKGTCYKLQRRGTFVGILCRAACELTMSLVRNGNLEAQGRKGPSAEIKLSPGLLSFVFSGTIFESSPFPGLMQCAQ